jgi:hypothetical protein
MVTRGSLLYSEQPVTEPYPKLVESSPLRRFIFPYNLCWYYLFSHLSLSRPSGLFFVT